MSKTKKLVLKEKAPEEVRIVIGMDYKRTFKRANQPFSVDKKIADSILRTSAHFEELEEPQTATPPPAENQTPPTAQTPEKGAAGTQQQQSGAAAESTPDDDKK